MSKELTLVPQNTAMSVWEEQKDIIRKTIAPDATEAEFLAFCSYGQAVGANPLKKEIFFVKYVGKDKKVSISMTVARDFHRKKAQEQPTHRGQTVECVYSNDKYEVRTTLEGLQIAHSRGIEDRGKLLGAYSLTYDDRLTHPHFEECLLKNYRKSFGVWLSNEEAMIKKCASACGYRAVYTGVLGSVYSEAEQWLSEKPKIENLALNVLDGIAEPMAIPEKTEKQPQKTETFNDKKARLKAEAMTQGE